MGGSGVAAFLIVLLTCGCAQGQNESHSFGIDDPIVWEPENGLVAGYYEDVSFIVTSGEVKTLEVVLFIETMSHAVSLYIRSSNDDGDSADPRLSARAACIYYGDECQQQQLFQYTQPPFLRGPNEKYAARIALRVQPTYPTESLTGRWTVSIANNLRDTSAGVKLEVWQRTYGYWDVIATIVVGLLGVAALLVATWDFFCSIGSQTRVLRPAEEGRVVRRQIAAVYRQMASASSALREPEQQQQQTRKQWYKIILVGSLVAVAITECSLLLVGYAFKGVVGVMTFDIENIHWEVDMYHHLVGLAVILSYITHIELFMGTLESVIPASHVAWRYFALIFTLFLEALTGYLAHFILWCLNSTVWEWQIHYCKGYAVVLVYTTMLHHLVQVAYERWRSHYVVEHVVEPSGRGKGDDAALEEGGEGEEVKNQETNQIEMEEVRLDPKEDEGETIAAVQPPPPLS